jgi:hypothetical protein
MEAKVRAVPSPTGGWNARDSLDMMKEDQAVVLDNWFPMEGRCQIRKGFSEHATTLGGDVETLAEFHDGAVRKFLAAANGNIWNITSAGAGVSLGSGYSNNRWQTANFNGLLGLVNGEDAPLEFDGSAISTMTISGSSLTVANLIGINVFKSRTYFWEDDSQDFWYSAVNALGGTLTKFPLSRVSQFGGKLVTMGTWTRDGGDGVDDLAVFFMSSGETVIYQGSNPGDASDWALVGIFRIGAPLSIRGVVKFGADLIVMTKDGYVPLTSVLNVGRGSKGAISDQINGAVSEATREFGDNYGWQAILYPRSNMLLFNVPVTTNTTYRQHVFNTLTGAPCQFKGMNARCWGLYNDRLYFGGNASVYLADEGNDDDGANIDTDALPAYNYLGSRAQLKQVTAVQNVLSTESDLPVSVSLGIDFSIPVAAYNPSTYTATGATWDVADWDVADWTGGSKIHKPWNSIGGIGMNFSSRLKIRGKNESVNWYSTNYMYKRGGLV